MSELNDAQLELFRKWRAERSHPSHTTVKSHELKGLIDLALRASALAATVRSLLIMLEGDYDGAEMAKVCNAARAALSSTTPKCPQDGNAPQAAESHEDGDKS